MRMQSLMGRESTLVFALGSMRRCLRQERLCDADAQTKLFGGSEARRRPGRDPGQNLFIDAGEPGSQLGIADAGLVELLT